MRRLWIRPQRQMFVHYWSDLIGQDNPKFTEKFKFFDETNVPINSPRRHILQSRHSKTASSVAVRRRLFSVQPPNFRNDQALRMRRASSSALPM